MSTTFRHYNHDSDYERVSQFLVKTYRTTGDHVNWLQARWEYMHHHPHIKTKRVDLGAIGIWEAAGEIVGVVHPEHFMGTAYFEFDPSHTDLKREMLAHAEQRISVEKNEGKLLNIHINDLDVQFQEIATEMGYLKQDEGHGSGAMSHFIIPISFPSISVPEGFRLISLEDDNNLAQITRVFHRGFESGDELSDDAIEERKFMQSAPNYRKDLNIVIVAPNGNFVSYGGIWYETVNQVAYVEPVCTAPEYRRMGLASAAVLEGIRRCGELGATVAYVGAILPVYLSIGFRQIFNCSQWRREWT
ncbi:GNAT family N-acetyltransferase [Candidatus Hydrogenedentota bacterium]